MHELAIVEAIIEQVGEEVRSAGAGGRIVGIDLAIGRLSGVCVDSIRFAFEMLAPGTPLEGTAIRIREPQAECACRACGSRSPIADITLECPRCGAAEVSIEGGRELLLETIELDE